jgi:hypothetical protein
MILLALGNVTHAIVPPKKQSSSQAGILGREAALRFNAVIKVVTFHVGGNVVLVRFCDISGILSWGNDLALLWVPAVLPFFYFQIGSTKKCFLEFLPSHLPSVIPFEPLCRNKDRATVTVAETIGGHRSRRFHASVRIIEFPLDRTEEIRVWGFCSRLFRMATGAAVLTSLPAPLPRRCFSTNSGELSIC